MRKGGRCFLFEVLIMAVERMVWSTRLREVG